MTDAVLQAPMAALGPNVNHRCEYHKVIGLTGRETCSLCGTFFGTWTFTPATQPKDTP